MDFMFQTSFTHQMDSTLIEHKMMQVENQHGELMDIVQKMVNFLIGSFTKRIKEWHGHGESNNLLNILV